MSEESIKQPFVIINGVKIYLFDPIESEAFWFGQEEISRLLVAAWLARSPRDRVMSPVLVGPPGCGKTTLARHVARKFGRPVYIMNCTSDMRPEDLLIMTVLSPTEKFRYQASGLVSAMITGGICILDEANRMNEKSWASLASLLDDRGYIDSITAGVRIHAHAQFRIVATMNEDSSTFNIPDYIESRLKPVFPVSYPTRTEMIKILAHHVPDADDDLKAGIVQYLHEKKEKGCLEDFSTRDAIHIANIAMKLSEKRPEFITTEGFVGSIAPYIVQVEEREKHNPLSTSWI
jgi:MoxR-like ATPase